MRSRRRAALALIAGIILAAAVVAAAYVFGGRSGLKTVSDLLAFAGLAVGFIGLATALTPRRFADNLQATVPRSFRPAGEAPTPSTSTEQSSTEHWSTTKRLSFRLLGASVALFAVSALTALLAQAL